MAVIKIKSTHPPSQGEFVLIEEEDFDPAKGHVLYEPPSEEPSRPGEEPRKVQKPRKGAES